jgi:peptidoglycan/LPS O-acetylase OafA/YrhL
VTAPSRAGGFPFDHRDTVVLKGIAILAIVLHNYFHLLAGAVRENEFDFEPGRLRSFVMAIGEPTRFIQASFSYFGHYGVLLFIFLSAYGLAIAHWQPPNYRQFLWSRIRKIYPTWFIVVGLYLAFELTRRGPDWFLRVLNEHALDLVLTTLGVATLLPGYNFEPVGPWWFLPYIMQFYVLWPLLAVFARRFGGTGLVVLSVLGTGVWTEFPGRLQEVPAIRLLFTPVGHLPSICLGIAYARFGARVGPWSAAGAAVFFALGNHYRWFWPVSFIGALVLMLYTYQHTSTWLRQSRFLVWVGGISMPLFFVNGFLRPPFWRLAASGAWYAELGAAVCFTAFSLAVAFLVAWLARRIARAAAGGPPPAGPEPLAALGTGE